MSTFGTVTLATPSCHENFKARPAGSRRITFDFFANRTSTRSGPTDGMSSKVYFFFLFVRAGGVDQVHEQLAVIAADRDVHVV